MIQILEIVIFSQKEMTLRVAQTFFSDSFDSSEFLLSQMIPVSASRSKHLLKVRAEHYLDL